MQLGSEVLCPGVAMYQRKCRSQRFLCCSCSRGAGPVAAAQLFVMSGCEAANAADMVRQEVRIVLGLEVDLPRCTAYQDVCWVFGAGLCCPQL
jgi:hypothetical protein